MTLVRDDAQSFWSEDLEVVEKRYLKVSSVTDLPAMKEEWRAPNQGSVLSFSTINIDALISKWDFRVLVSFFKQTLRNLY